MMHAMKDLHCISFPELVETGDSENTYDAHALPGCDKCGNADHEPNRREHSVATPCVT